MGLPLQRGGGRLLHGPRQGHAAVEHRAQHQGVDEKTHHVADLRRAAIGHRHADAQVGLPGIAVQQHLKSGQQAHEQGDAGVVARSAQRGAQTIGQEKLVLPGPIAHHRLARKVAGQAQGFAGGAQLRAPVAQLAFAHAALGIAPGQPLPLPDAVIGVLHGQRR